MHERKFVAKKWQKWSQSWMLSFKWTLEKFNAHGHDNFGRLTFETLRTKVGKAGFKPISPIALAFKSSVYSFYIW